MPGGSLRIYASTAEKVKRQRASPASISFRISFSQKTRRSSITLLDFKASTPATRPPASGRLRFCCQIRLRDGCVVDGGFVFFASEDGGPFACFRAYSFEEDFVFVAATDPPPLRAFGVVGFAAADRGP
jgi:hypothetical protein